MKIVFLVFVMAIMSVAGLSAIGSAIYWTQPTINEIEAEVIARHDLAIIDLENLFNNPDNLRAIKRVNTQCKLLAYINFFEVWQSPIPPNRPFGSRLSQTITSQFSDWLLVRPDGQPAGFWPGMQPLNLSDLCPVIQGYTYTRYIQEILLENILNDRVWDGIFLDNLFDRVSWLGELDLDRDGRADDARTVDYHWYRGVSRFLTGIRQAKGSRFQIWGNHLSLFWKDNIDGRFLEDFPTQDWCWEEAMAIAGQLPEVVFQGKGRGMDLAFNSSLLLDNAFFCLGQNMAVPDSMLAKLNSLKKLPANQRGILIFNAADHTYQRQLGEELIQVRLNRQTSD
jgi:hypothetical protein